VSFVHFVVHCGDGPRPVRPRCRNRPWVPRKSTQRGSTTKDSKCTKDWNRPFFRVRVFVSFVHFVVHCGDGPRPVRPRCRNRPWVPRKSTQRGSTTKDSKCTKDQHRPFFMVRVFVSFVHIVVHCGDGSRRCFRDAETDDRHRGG
jgi:hypothetical protein